MRDNDNWLRERRRLAGRRRRIMYNNDGDDAYFAPKPTPESFLAARSKGIEGTHVDTYVYSTLANFDSCGHDARVAEISTFVDPFVLPHNHVQALIDQGHDSLSLIVGFCRENGLEVFWSARMNDMHDNWDPRVMTSFRREHPELRLWRDGDYGRPGDNITCLQLFAVIHRRFHVLTVEETLPGPFQRLRRVFCSSVYSG